MFVYNTRTEIDHGTKFIEKDVILFDYSYTGDIVFQVDAVLETSGFGFVIQEDTVSDVQTSDNIVLITIGNDNSYKVILKNNGEQTTAIDHFIDAAVNVYGNGLTTLFFKKHNATLSVYKGIRQEDGSYQEIKLFSYTMQYDMDHYLIGIYSNAGNTVAFASVKTEAPTNWISNVINAGGGRIQWIRNGFTIEEAEYDIEVEAEDIPMKPGTYWIGYETDNPDMKAYVYHGERKHTATKRLRADIIETMDDEIKNLLQEDGSFTLESDSAINIKFKAKWGTVTNICLKNDKFAEFVETGYGITTRPRSQLKFDLNLIDKIHIKATILSLPTQDSGEARDYYIFRRGEDETAVTGMIHVGQEQTYDFTTADGLLKVNGSNFKYFRSEDPELTAFNNVTANITEFIITLANGEVIDILLQKTFKYSVPSTITSPILVVDSNNEPLDLSSSYRLLAKKETKLELFNAQNPIKLSYDTDISYPDIHVYGIPKTRITEEGELRVNIHKDTTTIQEMADHYKEIAYTIIPEDILKRTIKIPYEIREKYQYIAVSYQAITDHRYYFTNWERELFNLKEEDRIYLEHAPLDPTADIIVYGIEDETLFNQDLLYDVNDISMETSIDLSAYTYDILDPDDYTVNALNKVVIGTNLLKKYRYLVIDYLKAESYAVNETDDNYELDIASADTQFQIMYDSTDGFTTESYRVLTIDKLLQKADEYAIETSDFVVLETTQ